MSKSLREHGDSPPVSQWLHDCVSHVGLCFFHPPWQLLVTLIVTFTGVDYLLEHCAKRITCNISVNPPDSSMRAVILSPLHQMRNQRLTAIKSLARATQKTRTQGCVAQAPAHIGFPVLIEDGRSGLPDKQFFWPHSGPWHWVTHI